MDGDDEDNQCMDEWNDNWIVNNIQETVEEKMKRDIARKDIV